MAILLNLVKKKEEDNSINEIVVRGTCVISSNVRESDNSLQGVLY